VVVEGGERLVPAPVGERREVLEQRRDVLGVEHRDAQRLVALEHEVGGRVAQARQPRADGLRGGEAVEAALRGLLCQLGDHRAGDRGAVLQRAGGRLAEAVTEPPPVAGELAPGGVQLAQRAVLRAVHAHRYFPGSHRGSPPPLAPRARMKRRSERRFR
jgi:hypothetical protein